MLICVAFGSVDYQWPGQAHQILRGGAYVLAHCAQCHSIHSTGDSPLPQAPPFRTMRLRYLVTDLIRPLSEGAHPPMPRFDVTQQQAMDIMVYINSLRRE